MAQVDFQIPFLGKYARNTSIPGALSECAENS